MSKNNKDGTNVVAQITAVGNRVEKSVSFRDVINYVALQTDNISNNEFLLLDIGLNNLYIKQMLFTLGINTEQPISISASKHRDLSGNVSIGYRYNGIMRVDKEWLDSRGCDLMERIAATSLKDNSLTSELCNLQRGFVGNYGSSYNDDSELPDELYSETYEEDRKLIDTLNEIVKNLEKE